MFFLPLRGEVDVKYRLHHNTRIELLTTGLTTEDKKAKIEEDEASWVLEHGVSSSNTTKTGTMIVLVEFSVLRRSRILELKR